MRDPAPSPDDSLAQRLPLAWSMVWISSASVCRQVAASGLPARSASSARSMALSTRCQSDAERGLRPASAASQDFEVFDALFRAGQVTLVDNGSRIDGDGAERPQIAERRRRGMGRVDDAEVRGHDMAGGGHEQNERSCCERGCQFADHDGIAFG